MYITVHMQLCRCFCWILCSFGRE